jgi:hypothetical protein
LKRRDSFDKAGNTICRRIEFFLPHDMPNVSNDMASGELLGTKIIQEHMCNNQNDRIANFKKK